MQMPFKVIGTLTLAAILAAGLVSVARAQTSSTPLTDEQRSKIVANCVVIKSSLEQLHASDALLRVNRGQVYESLANNLMEPFNSRLDGNDLDNAAMTTVTAQYRTALTTFRTDYIAYEQKLAEAIKVDCANRPDQFHQAVQAARILRATVHEDVQKLHRSVDDYQLSVGDFLLNYERVSR